MARFIKKNTIPLNVIAKQALYEALSFGSPGAMNSQFGQRLGSAMGGGFGGMGGGVRRPTGRGFGGAGFGSMQGNLEVPFGSPFKDKFVWPGGGMGGGFGGGGFGGGGFGGGMGGGGMGGGGFGGLDAPMFAPGQQPGGGLGGGGFGGGMGGGGFGGLNAPMFSPEEERQMQQNQVGNTQQQSKSKDLETSPIQSPVSGSGDVRRPEEPLGTKPVEQPDSENNPNSPNYRPPTVEGEKTGGAGLGQETFGTKDADVKKGLEAARAKIDADEDAKMQQELSPEQYKNWKLRKQTADQAKRDPNSDIARRSKAASWQREGNLAAEKRQQDTSITQNQKTLSRRDLTSGGRAILTSLQQKAQKEAEEGKLGRMPGAPR